MNIKSMFASKSSMCVHMSMCIFVFIQKQKRPFPLKSFFSPCKSTFCLIFCTKTALFPFQAFLLCSLIPYGYTCVGKELC